MNRTRTLVTALVLALGLAVTMGVLRAAADARVAQLTAIVGQLASIRDSSPALPVVVKGYLNKAINNLNSAITGIPSLPNPCSYTVTPTATSFAAGGGTGSVSVVTAANCSWSASTGDGWIIINNGVAGNGPGGVGYTVAPNATTSVRTGSLMVAGRSVTITEAAATQPPPTPPPADGSAAHSFGMWAPSKWDTCSKALHDSYFAIGPDGKKYPTWHPPTATENGKACTFGHEHGRNPNGSALLADIKAMYGGLLFGYGNEQLDVYNASHGIGSDMGMRHEDHVGHKIEWENNVRMDESVVNGGSQRRALDITCDFFMKAHQGTHSKDAFTNNVHELLYAVQCRDGSGGAIGTKVIVTKMVVFGQPGGFSEGSVASGFQFIGVGPFSPPNAPSGPGLRSLPTINRVKENILVPAGQWSQFSQGLYEDWISSNYIYSGAGKQVLYFDPHFAVFSPSRFYDPSKADGVGRSIDVCWMNQNGEKARGGECDAATNFGQITTPIPYDDPRSPFNGVQREFYFNNTQIANAGGATTLYTNPYGGQGSTNAAAGSIRQFISAVLNARRNDAGYIDPSGRAYHFESIAVGKNRNYGGNGVHAPN